MVYRNNNFKYLFEGVYKNSEEASKNLKNNSFFNLNLYKKNQIKIIKLCNQNFFIKKNIPVFYKQHTQYLINSISILNKKNVSVLDVGGGWGIGHLHCLESFSKKIFNKLRYYIYDIRKIWELGEIFYKKKINTNNLFYSNKLDELLTKKFDIIFFGSSLQYFDEPLDLLKRVIRCNFKYLIFIDVYLTNQKTFFTLQNYYGAFTSHSFINRFDFFKILEKKTRLISITNSHTVRLDKINELNMNNFPKKLRVKNSFNIILKKK